MKAIDEAYEIDKQSGNEEKTAIRLVQKAAVLDSQGQHNQALSALNL